MRKRYVIFLFFLAVSRIAFDVSHVYAQFTTRLDGQPTQEWVARYTGYGYENGLSVKLDVLGNVLVLVTGGVPGTTGPHYQIVKYSSAGSLIWSFSYRNDSTNGNYPSGFDISHSGDIFITGNISTTTSESILTVKVDSSGVLQWAKIIPNAGSDDIKLDRAGNVIVCGAIGDGSVSDAYIVKYDSYGDTLFTRKFRRALNSSGLVKLLVDESDNIYGCGDDAADYLVLKYNSVGNLDWYSNWSSVPNFQDFIYVAAIDSLRNVYTVGTTYHPFSSGISNTLVKFGNNGMVVWANTFSGIMTGDTTSGIPGGIAVSSDDFSVYYTTYCYSPGPESTDIVTLKYDSAGGSLWLRNYSGGNVTGGNNAPATLFLDKYGNVYITGYGQFPVTGIDFATLKYAPSGTQQWEVTYNGPLTNSEDGAKDLVIDTSLNVYVTGVSQRTTNGGYDVATIKYSQPNGVEQISTDLPGSFKLEQNYPNPFNSITMFHYEVLRKSNIRISIYNVIGQLVRDLVNTEQQAGKYRVELDAGDLASGIYFYTLFADNNKIDSKKFVLIK